MWPLDEGSAATAVSPSGPEPPAGSAGMPADATPAPGTSAPVDRTATASELGILTRAARRGDAEAFSRLYDLYSFRVYKFLLALTHGDEYQAREVCQAVFIKLARRCDAFDDERRYWGWLCVLARNSFVDHCRARQRLNRFVSLEEWSAEPNSRADAEHRLSALLQEALAALPPAEQELLQAAYVDQRPLGELAAQAGQTYKAVESRLGRLRQKLKTQLLKALCHENES